jgi:hypothetical protein
VKSLTDLPIQPDAEPKKSGTPRITEEQEQTFANEEKLKSEFALEQQKIDSKRQAQEQKNNLANKDKDLGWFGKFLGSGDNLTNNIGGLVIFACLIIVLITLFLDIPLAKNLETTKTRELLFGVIMTTLGFIFGASKK